MTPTLVHDIIEKLALGIDPVTGAPLRHESVFHHPTVIRALFFARDAVKRQYVAAKRAEAEQAAAQVQGQVATSTPNSIPVAATLQHVSRAATSAKAPATHWTAKLAAQRNQPVDATITMPPESSAGKKWDPTDRNKLLALFKRGASIRDIAFQLGRSEGGIISKLVREGVLKDREEGRALVDKPDGEGAVKS
ncbi:winged helix-turn-helix domain-containing protein [Pseudoduganella sp. UC29_106]|uniref:winged helix-turn-helix domain-containing protein n=1 Tax=Pseudoduganella sp. UC29_106 TaxID=3374553 RepID=UPI0037565417